MKIRLDFVTNSSSSSFIISKFCLSDDQIEGIRNHALVAEKLNLKYYEDSWSIDENNKSITGDTSMDNFSMREFLIDILKINPKVIQWNEYGFYLDDYDYDDNDFGPIDIDELGDPNIIDPKNIERLKYFSSKIRDDSNEIQLEDLDDEYYNGTLAENIRNNLAQKFDPDYKLYNKLLCKHGALRLEKLLKKLDEMGDIDDED